MLNLKGQHKEESVQKIIQFDERCLGSSHWQGGFGPVLRTTLPAFMYRNMLDIHLSHNCYGNVNIVVVVEEEEDNNRYKELIASWARVRKQFR